MKKSYRLIDSKFLSKKKKREEERERETCNIRQRLTSAERSIQSDQHRVQLHYIVEIHVAHLKEVDQLTFLMYVINNF